MLLRQEPPSSDALAPSSVLAPSVKEQSQPKFRSRILRSLLFHSTFTTMLRIAHDHERSSQGKAVMVFMRREEITAQNIQPAMVFIAEDRQKPQRRLNICLRPQANQSQLKVPKGQT